MASTAYLNDTVRITVTFREWSSSTGSGLEDPETVIVHIIHEDESVSVQPVKESDAVYYYDWTPGELGAFIIRFTATFADESTDVASQEFEVLEYPSKSLVEESDELFEDFELRFAAGFDPLYVDPEAMQPLFPEASMVEVAKQIYLFSSEIKSRFKLKDNQDPPEIAIEYIFAAAACALSRVFELTSNGDELSIRLGDMSVTNRNFPKSKVTRGNATTWCELAAALRFEMLSKVPMKGVVRGDRLPNPIPVRKLRSYK